LRERWFWKVGFPHFSAYNIDLEQPPRKEEK